MKKTTRERILAAGLKLWPDVSLTAVAQACKLSHVGVLYHFPDGGLKEAVAEYAVQNNVSGVIVQLIGAGHSAVENLSPADRLRHFNAIL